MTNNIGTFSAKDKDGVAIGDINTLELQLSGVRMEPNKDKRGEDSPDVYFKFKNVNLGSGWEKIAVTTGNKYISVTIDDPSLANPIKATLHPNDAGGYELVHRR
jgi:uncharacterized protein (DUF736 family)